jgi:RNA polymerase sigma-70 factor (ECF subfamily)
MAGMPAGSPEHRIGPSAGAEFATTHWSLVVRAGDRGQPDAEAALAWLCERYWLPLYVYVRRHGRDAEEAQDLTQEFFARLFEKNTLAVASPQRGRFRSFLLTAMKNFLANKWDGARARKRGGGRPRLSLDVDAGESRLNLTAASADSPEQSYERQWALTLLELVVSKLEAEFAAAGKARQFELLKGAITGEGDIEYEPIAAELGMSTEAARQAASRLRKRYRELLRAEVAATVAEPGDVDDEIRSLFGILGS